MAAGTNGQRGKCDFKSQTWAFEYFIVFMLPSKACQSLCWEEKHFQQQFVGSLGRLLSFMCGFSLNCSNHLLPNVQICTGGFSTQIYSALSGAHYPSAWWSFLRRGPVIMISATLSFSIRASNQTRERDVWFCVSVSCVLKRQRGKVGTQKVARHWPWTIFPWPDWTPSTTMKAVHLFSLPQTHAHGHVLLAAPFK